MKGGEKEKRKRKNRGEERKKKKNEKTIQKTEKKMIPHLPGFFEGGG